MGFSSQYQYEIQDEVIIYSVDYTSTDNPIDMSEFELPPEVPDMSDPENDPSKLKTTWVYTIRSKKKTEHCQNRFSYIFIYQNTPYYISN